MGDTARKGEKLGLLETILACLRPIGYVAYSTLIQT
jgi:hypothetical protein